MSKIFIEAESFLSLGGWTVDTQSMEVIGSSYLMAHGMGNPVSDAKTEFSILNDGEYKVFALTRDWTKQWCDQSAGLFKILIDDVDYGVKLGNESKDWAWQFSGKIYLNKGKHSISLKDLTGFNGRVDAIIITDEDFIPKNDKKSIEQYRKDLNYKEIVDFDTKYDLIVVGGGIAGTVMALSAVWSGVNTILINDRGVLGGCNSSEIRVCLGGKSNLPPYNRIGDVLRMVAPIMTNPSVFKEEAFEDYRKIAAFEAIDDSCQYEHGKHLLRLNESVTDVEKDGDKIVSVITTNSLTGKKTRYFADLFADCSGDAVVSRKAGATVMYGRDARDVFNESLAPLSHQNLVMGQSIRWYTEKNDQETYFPDVDWGLKFNDDTCLNVYNGDWEQETGFTRNMVLETEYIRDYGLRAIYSNWSCQKNKYKNKDEFKNYSLKWVSPLGGKREGYRVVGDYISTQNDIENHVVLPDSTSCATWSIDMHFPEQTNLETYGEAFRSFAYHRGIEKPYQVPYRCLYAKDVSNLFLGGRIISASHVSLSVLRVMRTLGQLGEVVGLASKVCKKHACMPKDVYENHLDEFISLLKEGVKIGDSFECDVGREESYHFKDFGWLFLDPYHKKPDKEITPKVKKCIKALEIEHKFELPDDLK